MKLLEISTDSVSLEFARYEQQAIMTRLAAFGRVTIDRAPTYERVRVDEIELIYMNEWDEPCLISSTAAGRDLLKAVSEGALPPADRMWKRPLAGVSIPSWLARKVR